DDLVTGVQTCALPISSLRPTSLTIAMTRITNYTQIFRNTWAVSGTNAATAMIAGNGNEAESRQECSAFHAVDIEKALLFGQKFQIGRASCRERERRGK